MKTRVLKIGAAVLMCMLLAGAATGAPVTPIVSQPSLLNIPALQKITSAALSNLVAMGDVEGQIFGASKGQMVALDATGKITRTINIPVDKPAGISAFTAGKAIVGDGLNNQVFAVDIKTGQATRLLDLRSTTFTARPPDPLEKTARAATTGILAGDILKTGTLMSVAFDGKNVLVAVSAGYSSSIFTIDPATNRAISQAWSPGDTPTAMQFTAGNLYVLDGANNQIRLLDSNLKLNLEAIEVPTPDPKGIIIRDNEVKVLSPSEKSIVVMKPNLSAIQLAKPEPLWQIRTDIVVGPILAMARDYALLICGDIAESGYDEFWNDTVWMYKTLLAAGYTEDHIYVMYGWGSDYNSANPAYKHSGTVTDFPATTVWVDKVLNGLKNGDSSIGVNKVYSQDSLFVWVFDHGGGGSSAYFCLRDGVYYDSTFGTSINSLDLKERAIFMQQCRSGGFVDNLQNEKSFVSTACLATENAHRADTEKEVVGGVTYHHGEYNYYVISALAGKTAAGAFVNADSNGDGKISAREAHTFMTARENQPESPQIWDAYSIGSSFIVK